MNSLCFRLTEYRSLIFCSSRPISQKHIFFIQLFLVVAGAIIVCSSLWDENRQSHFADAGWTTKDDMIGFRYPRNLEKPTGQRVQSSRSVTHSCVSTGLGLLSSLISHKSPLQPDPWHVELFPTAPCCSPAPGGPQPLFDVLPDGCSPSAPIKVYLSTCWVV